MEIKYPEYFVSKYPVVLRKAAKLLIAIDEDREYPDEAEWVPEKIAFESPGKWWVDDEGTTDLDIEQHIVTCKGRSITVWFSSFSLDQNMLMKEFDLGRDELSEEEVGAWVHVVEEAIADISGVDALESIYSDSELVEGFEENTNVNKAFQRPILGQPGVKKVAAKKKVAVKRS